jgi:hypothetical protein
MMKKCSVFIVFATLLAAFALVMACSGIGSETGYTPPPGMGAVQLKLNRNIQRTVLPEGFTSVSQFAIFGVEFQAISGGLTIPEAFYELTDLEDPIDLFTGTYNIIVIGYLDYDDTEEKGLLPAAKAIVPKVINKGANSIETITLSVFDPSDEIELGTFEWGITNEVTGLTAASMDVTSISGNGSTYDITWSGTELTKGEKWEGSEDLKEGYYYVDFTLVKGVDSPRKFRHVLHVYRNMTSSFVYEFNDDKLTIITTGNFSFADPPIVTEKPKNYPPILSEVDQVILSLGEEDKKIITVSNASDASNGEATTPIPYTSFMWFCDFVVLEDIDGDTLVIDLSEDEILEPFDTAGEYTLTVIGFIGDVPYNSESIFIVIEP